MSNKITPNHREVISARDSITGLPVYPTATNNKLDVNASATISGSAIPISGATTAIVTAIVDGSGNQITTFGGGTQYTDGGVPPTHPVGNTIEWNDGSNWQTVSTAKPLPVTASLSLSNYALETGGNLATLAGTVTSSVLQGNIKQINGVVPLMGNGVTGTGSQRVTIASDNTAFSVNATLSAETTKVIGVTRTADGSGNLITSTGNALDINIKSGNITGFATSTKQSDGSQKTQIVDGSNVTIPSTSTATVNGNIVGLNTAPVGASSDFWPFYNNMSLGGGAPHIDAAGALVTRGAVTTDEGTSRASFTGSSISNSIGTATFTNGGFTVTGTGFSTIDLHFTQFVKLNADAESAWAEVAFVNSDTLLTLFTAYSGTGGTGTGSVSQVATKTGTGATFTVGSGTLTLATGTNSSATSYVMIPATDGSIIAQSSVAISQRIANQDIYIGLEAPISSPNSFARFHFSGTDNTKVITETGYNPTTNPSSNEQETNTITLPGAAVTSSANTYRIEQQAEQILFSINGAIVATHTKRIPHVVTEGQNSFGYDIKSVASGTVTTTNIVVDYMLSRNFDRIDVLQSPLSPLPASSQTITALPTATVQGQLVNNSADKFGRQVVLPVTIRDLTGTQTTTISASTSETTIVTQAASTFNDLLMLVISNTSASTTTRIDFRDTTAGSILFSLFAPAADTRGFSLGGVAIPQTTVNTNWTAQCASSTTDIRIYAVFAKNK